MTKAIQALAVVLGVQLLALGVQAVAGGSGSSAREAVGEKVLPGVSEDQVGLVVIEDAQKKRLELAREGGGFVVKSAASYPTDGTKAKDLLAKLLGAVSRGVVAQSAASHAGLGVKEGKAERLVTLMSGSGETLAKLYVGRAVAGGQFVRKDGEAKVHRIEETLTWDLSTAPSAYIDTQLVNFPQAKATNVAWHAGDAESARLILAKTLPEGATDPVWQLSEGGDARPADKGKADTVLRTLCKLRLMEPVAGAPAPEHGLTPPETRILVTLEGGEKLELHVGAKVKPDASDRYAMLKGKPFVVTVAGWSLDQILKEAKDLEAEAPKDALPLPGMPGKGEAGE